MFNPIFRCACKWPVLSGLRVPSGCGQGTVEDGWNQHGFNDICWWRSGHCLLDFGHACWCPKESSTVGYAACKIFLYSITLNSKLFAAPEGTYKHGVRSVFKDLIVKDGPLALYRGVTPIMIRAFPANAACFFGIELANKFFNHFTPNF